MGGKGRLHQCLSGKVREKKGADHSGKKMRPTNRGEGGDSPLEGGKRTTSFLVEKRKKNRITIRSRKSRGRRKRQNRKLDESVRGETEERRGFRTIRWRSR